MIFEILLFLAISFLTWLFLQSKNSRLAPGPTGIPFFGYWPSYLGAKPYERIDQWAKKYGDVVRVRIGGKPLYILNSLEAIRQAYAVDGNGTNFSNRPQNFTPLGNAFEFRSIGFTNGPRWALQRKLFSYVMRRNDPRSETATDKSAKEIVDKIGSACHQGPLDVYRILAEAVVNVVGTLVCGERLMETNPELGTQIMADSRLLFRISPPANSFMLRWIGTLLSKITNTVNISNEVGQREFKSMEKILRQHETSFDPSNLRDYVDTCLFERLRATSAVEKEWLGDKNLMANMLAFFIAGVDTTSSALYMALFLMAKYPLVQERCHEEIKSVSETDIVLKIGDKAKLPYTTAVISEISRYSIVPFSLSRENATKTDLCGYEIPARSQFIANFWTVSRNPKYFENPDEFNPDHFYGKDLPRELASLAFSVGKRGCPGENLASLEIFSFLTYVLRHFKIAAPSGVELTETFLPGFGRVLAPYKLHYTKRE